VRPMTVAQLCEWLSVSRRFIEGEVNKGHLRVRKISPRCVRILPSDVARWLQRVATVELDA
jgi:excisionase family DNA binding protein